MTPPFAGCCAKWMWAWVTPLDKLPNCNWYRIASEPTSSVTEPLPVVNVGGTWWYPSRLALNVGGFCARTEEEPADNRNEAANNPELNPVFS
jgi:hypothetical protein